jgi:hypothetical protein
MSMRAMPVLVVTLLVVVFASAVGLAGQDKAAVPQLNVTGSWVGGIKTSVSYSPIAISFKLEQKPDGVTGFGWPGEAQVPIQNVKREGNKLAFDISGEKVTYRFNLTVSADRLEGDVSATDQGHSWTGTARLDREKPKETEKK